MDARITTPQTPQSSPIRSLGSPQPPQTPQQPIGCGVGEVNKEVRKGGLSAFPGQQQLVGEPAALPPVGGLSLKKYTDEQAAALVAAGRLLQNNNPKGGWPGGKKKIECRPGESYPAAVARVAASLPAAERQHLRLVTAWVRDYERHDPDTSTQTPTGGTAGTAALLTDLNDHHADRRARVMLKVNVLGVGVGGAAPHAFP